MSEDLNTPIEAEIEKLAALFFTQEEVAEMLELAPSDLRETGPYYRFYMRGRLQGEVDLRDSIAKLAKSGSSPAQTMMLDILKKSEAKNITAWQK